MQLTLTILTLAAAVLAAPSQPEARNTCTPATYACAINPTTSNPGWRVCDVTGKWVYAGDCPPKTACHFLAANGSPYCLPV